MKRIQKATQYKAPNMLNPNNHSPFGNWTLHFLDGCKGTCFFLPSELRFFSKLARSADSAHNVFRLRPDKHPHTLLSGPLLSFFAPCFLGIWDELSNSKEDSLLFLWPVKIGRKKCTCFFFERCQIPSLLERGRCCWQGRGVVPEKPTVAVIARQKTLKSFSDVNNWSFRSAHLWTPLELLGAHAVGEHKIAETGRREASLLAWTWFSQGSSWWTG